MSLHKLTAGDGYTYLTRQVAAQDVADRGGYKNLGDYYSQRGEAPGVWMGRGLAGLAEPFDPSHDVTEAHMQALFGQGRHPDAERIEMARAAEGATAREADAASRLGAPFVVRSGATPFRTRVASAFAEFNAGLGLPRDWPVPPEERARIRTQVADKMFGEEFGRAPLDTRERAGFIARASRQATTAVAGYDLTFSPVKSVSALWAIAPLQTMRTIEAAHAAAVADTIRWLEDRAIFTRRGKGGVRQVDVRGVLAVAFTHRDSRSGDPDLHTHVAISNKVQALDGTWLALDGRTLHKLAVGASEHYNTRLETEVQTRLGVGFAVRQGGDPAKRPIRELIGFDSPGPGLELLQAWSSRRESIEVRRGELAAAFQADHGRPPTPIEAIQLAQQATLETRTAKHPARTHAEQRAAWRKQAVDVLGGEEGLSTLLASALARRRTRRRDAVAWARQAAPEVLRTVETHRATWQEGHVRAEAERRARGAGLHPAQVADAVDALVSLALAESIRLGADDPISEPPQLRRRDGSSMYSVTGTQLYTSDAVIDAERRLVATAKRDDGRRCDDAAVDVALVESAANGVELNPGQAELVRRLATSGARLQLAVAPAGTGKTTAMSVLARAWRSSGGQVVGLAPSAVAAGVLRQELDGPTDTLAKLIHSLHARTPADRGVPTWVTSIGPGTLVVVDEAGMAATRDLATAVEYVVARGGSVRLVGDDQQLAAIGAGGVLRDIAETCGAVTLSHVVRFTDPAEGAASLALRDGDPAALGYYLDHGRVHVGDTATAVDQSYLAWAADRAAGQDAVMLAPTRELAAELNTRAQADRPGGAGQGAFVTLAAGTRALAGDSVITRHNDRRLPITPTDWVKNGDRWTVDTVHPGGALDVTHVPTRRRIRLPAAYVAEHVDLGYATTIHGAQGVTADISHAVVFGEESRQLLYVALTRGRGANHVYVAVTGDGDDHTILSRDALLPPTAADILMRVLGRDGAQISATTAGRELTAPAHRLRDAAAHYADAVHVAAEHLLGADRLAIIDAAAEEALPGLTEQSAWPVLRGHLVLLALSGESLAAALRDAISARELDSAHDVAAVLDWRLDLTGRHNSSRCGPLPWLPGIPERLATDPHWGDYLIRKADFVSGLATEVRLRADAWPPASTPAWARSLLGKTSADPRLTGALAVWRAAIGIDDSDPLPTGTSSGPALTAAEARYRRHLDERVDAIFADPRAAATRWAPAARAAEPRLLTDPHWPVLADRLSTIARAGIDVATLLAATTAERPLPDEHAAAALWWRLAHRLSPAVLASSPHAAQLRPPWIPALREVVGDLAAERVVADPEWPTLVAAITLACRDHGWTPTAALSTAYELLAGGQPADEPLHPHELATALTWRIGMLVDHAEDPLPPADPVEQDNAPSASPPSVAPEEPPPAPVLDPEAEFAAAATRARLIALNHRAQRFFTDHYASSWAPTYLADRLDIDADDPELPTGHTVGYAPAGWTNLLDHLRHDGATDDELLAAGLAARTRSGRLIDRFRDRLVLPIHAEDGIRGFIARRNPAEEDAGPKYLNTPETEIFLKGTLLYGLYGVPSAAESLAEGARPVLVEGPLDAIAVSLAGHGRYVGVAPLGTALAEYQADQLRPFAGQGRPGVIVATDADDAGRAAAERAFWLLTARGEQPDHLTLPDGLDPADLLRRDGHAALSSSLTSATSLAQRLIDQRIDDFADRLHTPEGRVLATRAAAEVIGTHPPRDWPTHVEHLVTRTGVLANTAALEIFDAGHAWITKRGPATVGTSRRAGRLVEPHRTPSRTSPQPTPQHPAPAPRH